MIISTAYRALASSFREAGLETPELDARLLIAEATQMNGAQVLISDKELTQAQQAQIETFRTRRLAHEPVARILGRRAFWSFEVELSPETLEPRPDSETLVEMVLDLLGTRRHENLRMADLGTGSGILLIALLLECQKATGLGVDISQQAIETARRNATLNHVPDRAQFLCGNWLEGTKEKFDIIVSNPPYIASAEIAGLAEDVRLYDPLRALDGGHDGLDAYRAIARQAASHLHENGVLAVEIGSMQAEAVKAIFAGAGYQNLGQSHDLSGYVRALSFSPLVQKKHLEKPHNMAKTMHMP
ncbi:MAG: peptide chain release factor N(5)-glutamine methyltransferase [Pseudomonadota bacterium]